MKYTTAQMFGKSSPAILKNEIPFLQMRIDAYTATLKEENAKSSIHPKITHRPWWLHEVADQHFIRELVVAINFWEDRITEIHEAVKLASGSHPRSR